MPMLPLTPLVLTGRTIRLVPLEPGHHSALCEIGLDERLWRVTTIQVLTSQEMQNYMRLALEAQSQGTALPFVIEDIASGKIIGSTRFHSYAADHGRIEIGFTWITI